MKVYTLNCFDYNSNTGKFDKYCENLGVFILKHYAEQFANQHSLINGDSLHYVIEVFELWIN